MNFDILLISSFKEYIDRMIAQKLNAWEISDIPVFETVDDTKTNCSILGAGGRQWIFDSGITNNTVKASNLSNGWQNAKIDYKNSRIILPNGQTASQNPQTVSGAYKFFNSYISSDSDSTLYDKTDFNKIPELISPNSSKKPYSYYSPCYFVKISRTENEGFEIGGKDKTNYDIKVTCFANSEYERISMAGTFRDLKNTSAYVLNKTPLDEYNDLKESNWSFFEKMVEMKSLGQPKFYIENCSFSNITGDGLLNKFPSSYIGIANFKVFVVRNSRNL